MRKEQVGGWWENGLVELEMLMIHPGAVPSKQPRSSEERYKLEEKTLGKLSIEIMCEQ